VTNTSALARACDIAVARRAEVWHLAIVSADSVFQAASSRVSASLFRLLDTSTDLIAVFTPDLRQVYVNESVCRYMRLPREQIIGRRYDELPMSRANADLMMAAIAEVFRTGRPQRIEVRGTSRTTHETRVFDVAYDPEQGDNDTIELVVGVSRDVTALRMAEERSRADAERLSILLDSTGVAIAGVDPTLHLRFVNRNAAAILRDLGIEPRPSMVGLRIDAARPPGVPDLVPLLRHVLTTGEPKSEELRLEAAEGPRRLVLHAHPERREHEVVGVVVVARDVTLERQREAQLRQSEKLAALGRIAAGISHEIANPLSFVYGNLEQIDAALTAVERGRPLAARDLTDLREMLNDARQGSERIRGIIEDIGLLARDDVALLDRIDLGDLIHAATRLLERTEKVAHAGIELRLSEVPPIAGSAPRMTQAMTALLHNALDAMPPDRAPAENRVIVSLEAHDAEVVLTVVDNGLGIPEAERANVFDPFYTTRPVGSSVGLGLSIVHSIVASHRGTVAIEPAPGGGTIVSIRLPIPED